MADLPVIAADNMFKAIERITKAAAQWVVDNGGARSVNDMVIFLNQIPMESLIVDTLGFSGDLVALEATQVKLLTNFEVTAPITEGVVQSLIDVNNATFNQYIGNYATVLKQEMVKAVLAGVPRNQMVNAIAGTSGLEGAALKAARNQIKTIVDTSLKTFSRQVNAVMVEDMPADTKFVYIGVTDDETRDVCLAMIAAGPMTREEIDSQFPGAFIDGGGFNCRHRWAVQTNLSNKFTNPVKAQAEIKKQGINVNTVQTPQQIAGA